MIDKNVSRDFFAGKEKGQLKEIVLINDKITFSRYLLSLAHKYRFITLLRN